MRPCAQFATNSNCVHRLYSMPKSTTIQVSTDTTDRLEHLKVKGETYNDLLECLIDRIEDKDPFLKKTLCRIREMKEGKVKAIPFEQFRKERKVRRKEPM